MQLWQQAIGSGLSESDAMRALVKKGLKPSEVTQFKKRLVGMQSTKKSQFTNNNMIKDTAGFMRDSTWILDIPEIRKPSSRYGYDFFSNPNITFDPNLRVATPKNYVLGPDDQLGITLTGLNETEIEALINTEGNIRSLRTNAQAQKVFWLLPSQRLKPKQVEAVKLVAAEFGDTVIPRPESDISADGVHPTGKGYKKLADQTR